MSFPIAPTPMRGLAHGPQVEQLDGAPEALGFQPDRAPSHYPSQSADLDNEDDNGRFADVRPGARTPSPTPSEMEELNPPKFNFANFLKTQFSPAKLPSTIITIIVLAFIILLLVFQSKIVKAIAPDANKLKHLTAGWLIPVAILIILSFPPLLGQEIVGAMCGFVWGLSVGFAIVAAGTLIGETLNYFVFRTWCMARGRKREKKVISFACLAKVCREGGFPVVLAARYSILPSHYCTAVFATCGVSFQVYLIATILSLPQQLSLVYAGWILQPGEKKFEKSTAGQVINWVVLIFTISVTVIGGQYLQKRLNAAKPEVIYARRKARMNKGFYADVDDGSDAFLVRDHA